MPEMYLLEIKDLDIFVLTIADRIRQRLSKNAKCVQHVGLWRYSATCLVLKKNNLEPGRDVAVLQLAGGMPALAAALSKRSIYVATLSTPVNLSPEKYGARVLLYMARSGIYFPHSSIISMRSYVKSHRGTVKSFLAAYAGGLKRMVSDRAFSHAVIKKYMRVDDPELKRRIAIR